MKRVHLEFGPIRTGRTSVVLWVVMATAVILMVAGVAIGMGMSEKARKIARKTQYTEAQETQLTDAVRHQENVPLEVADAVNGAIRLLDYPSIEMLTQLEHHARPEVSVVSVELGAIRSSVRIVVQADNASQVLDYMEAIKTEPAFRNVALTRQESAANNSGQGTAGWRFTLEVPQAEAPSHAAGAQKGQVR